MLDIKVVPREMHQIFWNVWTVFTGRYRNFPSEHVKDHGKDSKWPNWNCSRSIVRSTEIITGGVSRDAGEVVGLQ